MIIREKQYQLYKQLCLRLREISENNDNNPEINEAIKTCEHNKKILDKLNPSYKKRFMQEML